MKPEIRNCGNCHHFTAGACSASRPLSFVGIHIRRKVKATQENCGAHRMRAVRKVLPASQTGLVQP